MKKLWLRISFTFFLLMLGVLLAVGFLLVNLLEETYVDMTRNQLLENAQLLIKAVDLSELYEDPDALQEKISHFTHPVQPRFTIIDENGNVLADSESDPKHMDNHRNRPEVKAIIDEGKQRGESIHYSDTLGFHMMYVTVPLYKDSERIGVVRTAVALNMIDQTIKQLWVSLFTIIGITLLLSWLVSIRLAKGITRPIEKIVDVARRLTNKDYESRVTVKSSGEIGQLSNAINVLASSLQKQMREIQEHQQQLTSILANMVSGVMLVNEFGVIQLMNAAMKEFLGPSAHDFIGKLHTQIDEQFKLSENIQRCMEIEQVIHKEITMESERIFDAHFAPFLGENNRLKGVIVVLHEITEIRRLEKVRSEFVANVSHELKTPITSVKGFAETLLEGAADDPELRQTFLKIIHEESNRLHRLINDILHLSKIEQHLIDLQIEKVDVTHAVYDSVETLQEELTKKEITISLPGQKSVFIEGETDRIRQIILNLVSNAITYTPSHGKISVNLLEHEEHIELIVSDTGIGIPKEDLPRVFERFYRVDKARARHSGGTGLGLAIVKHLVESHHGHIQVDSIEGVGTTFIVTLPKNQPKEKNEALGQSQE